MKRRERGFTILELLVFLVLPLIIAFTLFQFWLLGSVITSGVKAFTDNCGKTYAIERVVRGNWFCPD